MDDADRQERLAARRAVKDRQQQLVVDGIIREAEQKMAACESALEAVGTAEAPVRAGAGDAAELRAADVREIEGAQWFSKACPQERFATVLYKSGHKSKKRLYCYKGGGSLDANAWKAAGGMVCLC